MMGVHAESRCIKTETVTHAVRPDVADMCKHGYCDRFVWSFMMHNDDAIQLYA